MTGVKILLDTDLSVERPQRPGRRRIRFPAGLFDHYFAVA
jgi:hypothetical protein